MYKRTNTNGLVQRCVGNLICTLNGTFQEPRHVPRNVGKMMYRSFLKEQTGKKQQYMRKNGKQWKKIG